jgi:hypothetical protein
MKKIILAITLFCTSAAAFAGGDHKSTVSAEKNISANIRSQIAYPEFLKEKEGEHTAALIFQVTDCGTIRIKDIECDDHDLRENLYSQSGNIKIDTTGLDTRDTYKVVVRFETL